MPHYSLTICYPLMLLLTVQVYVGFPCAKCVSLSSIGAASKYHPVRVNLKCNSNSSSSSSSSSLTTFFSRVGHNVRNVTWSNGAAVTNILIFNLTTENEGFYYCMKGGMKSNEVLLVAYPFSNSTIKTSYTARLGDTVVMDCTIPVGVLRQLYTVRWFKGLTEITPDDFLHITISDNGSLVITGVRVSDGSSGYSCTVNVTRDGGPVHRQGSPIALHVSSPIHMTSGLRSMSVDVGKGARFTCLASGIPAPEFRWLLNGSDHTVGVTSTNETRMSTIIVGSTLHLPVVSIGHSGTVTCVAFHAMNGRTVTVASTGNLVVLTNEFRVDLILQDSQVRVRGTLPVFIPGFFSLRVRFYSSEAVTREENTVISDSSLADTNEIDVIIPRGKLPSFNRFTVAIAIRTSERSGPFTVQSNPLNLPSDFANSSCNCICGSSPSPRATVSSATVPSATVPSATVPSATVPSATVPSRSSCGSQAVVAVVSVLVVLLVIGIIILVIGCIFIYYKKITVYKPSSEYSPSPRATAPRSVSRSSCGSQGSNHSSRSSRSRRSCSSQSDASSHKDTFTLERLKEEPRDIRDYETIDHKKLKQWGRNADHLDKNHHLEKNKLGGSFEEQLAPVRREKEPVFPHTHIGVPNPLTVPRQPFKDSSSSFEDLEVDCKELSMEVPRSC